MGSCKGNTITCSKDAVKLPIWRGYSFFCVAGAEHGTRLFLACRHNDANYDKLIELNDCLIAASSAQPGQRAGHGGLTAECEYGGHVSAELQWTQCPPPRWPHCRCWILAAAAGC